MIWVIRGGTEYLVALHRYRDVLDAIIAARPERSPDLEAEETELRAAIGAELRRAHARAFGEESET